MITITCPKCNAAMNCDDSAAGQVVKCYACQNDIVVPAPQAAAPVFEAVAPEAPAAPAAAKSSNVLGFAGIGLGLVALVVALIAAVYAFCFAGGSEEPWDFQKTPEKTAKEILKKGVERAKTDGTKKSYFFQKYGDQIVKNAEFEVEEDDNLAVVFVKSKIKNSTVTEVFYLYKNADGYYVKATSDDINDASEKFLKKVAKKESKYREDDESKDIDFEDLKDK